MRSLIVEDEFTSRMQLNFFLKEHGSVDMVVDGQEAINSIEMAYSKGKPYDLICLDIKMPGMDGHETLKKIRACEDELGLDPAKRVKIFMTTAMVDAKNLSQSYYELCDEFLAKPVEGENLKTLLKKYNLA